MAIPKAWHDLTDYFPDEIETPAYVRANDRTKVDKGWADPERIESVLFAERKTYENDGVIALGDDGYPLNPTGPTGKRGRLLGKWGPNQAVDPLILHKGHQGWRMLAISRKDTNTWAMPGGMVDAGESITDALARELHEETSVVLDMKCAETIYQGIVKNDPRNTDNAWMETSVALLVLDDDEAKALTLKAGDDARDVKWLLLNDENLNKLYANHATFVRQALKKLSA